MRKKLLAAVLMAVSLSVLAQPALAVYRLVFEDFDQVVYLFPEQSGNYYAIPNGDDEQYFGQACDPEGTACILSGSDVDGTDYARLLIRHDPTPTGYDNADVAGIPTGYTRGSGDQLWCVAPDQPLVMTFRGRWGDMYNQSGQGDVAIGSSGFGIWNNPVTPEGLAPVTAAFFQWVDGFGLSTIVTKAVGDQTQIVSFRSVNYPLNMNDWNVYEIQIQRMLSGSDQIKFSVRNSAGAEIFVNVVTMVGMQFDCGSLEMWNDIQTYGPDGVPFLQNLPVGAEQYLDIDYFRFEQP